MCVCVCIHVKIRDPHWCLQLLSPFNSLRQNLSWNLGLPNWLVSPKDPPIYLLALGFLARTAISHIFPGCWGTEFRPSCLHNKHFLTPLTTSSASPALRLLSLRTRHGDELSEQGTLMPLSKSRHSGKTASLVMYFEHTHRPIFHSKSN